MEETGFRPALTARARFGLDLVGKIQRGSFFLLWCQSLEALAQVPVLDFMSSLNSVACLKNQPTVRHGGTPGIFFAAEPL